MSKVVKLPLAWRAVLTTWLMHTLLLATTFSTAEADSFGIPHHHPIKPERYGIHPDYAGRVYTHSSIRYAEDGTHSELTYNITTRKGLVSLDQYADIIESVACGADWLKVKVDPLAAEVESTQLQYQELNAGLSAVGGVLTGSVRWGCNDADGFPGPFQRRVVVGRTSLSDKIETEHVTYFECFEHINVRFHSDEPKPVESESTGAIGAASNTSAVFVDDHQYRRGRRGSDSSTAGFSHRFTRSLLKQGPFDVTCKDCYVSARIGIDFELEMSGLTLVRFKIGLSGSVKATVRLVATVSGSGNIFSFDKKLPFSNAVTDALSVAVFGPVSMAIKP